MIEKFKKFSKTPKRIGIAADHGARCKSEGKPFKASGITWTVHLA